MPTLPLYTPNDVADASHRVVAPGGYESWRFDAESSSGDVRLVAEMGEGDPYSAEYFRRYLRYRRRPTRTPPPLPSEYPYAHFGVYQGQRLLGQFKAQFPPDQFSASAQRPDVRLGANEFTLEPDGGLSLRLRGVPVSRTWRGDRSDPGACASAQLTFRPVLPHAPREVSPPVPGAGADEHRWVVANPLCEVAGTVFLTAAPDANGRGGREIDFRGRGYHDHVYGTGPLGNTFRRWMRGRVLAAGQAVTFFIGRSLRRGGRSEIRLIDADGAAVRESAVRGPPVLWSGRSGTGLRFPEDFRVQSAGLPELKLTRPLVLEAAPVYTRLMYSAEIGPHAGQALCEVGVAPRTAWRLWGGASRQSEGGETAPR